MHYKGLIISCTTIIGTNPISALMEADKSSQELTMEKVFANNPFKEEMLMTKLGKVWEFPINNDQGESIIYRNISDFYCYLKDQQS